MNKILFTIVNLFVFLPAFCIKSPFNNKEFNCDSLKEIKFIVTGHIHGSSLNSSGYPASTILANIDTLNKLDASFFISLGDLFFDIDSNIVKKYNRSFFSKLSMPIFNAPGNHDWSRGLYSSFFGKSYFSFKCKTNLFIILDSEINDGNISGKQFEFFNQKIKDFINSNNLKNVFIFIHRPIWSSLPEFKGVFVENTKRKFGINNYKDVVYPVIQKIPVSKKVFFFAGSLGPAPASFFYHKNKNITYIATAIRELKRDAILLVTINSENTFDFKTISLTGEKIKDIKYYDINMWKNYHNNPFRDFNPKLIPFYCYSAISNRYFWYGAILSVFFILFIILILKRKR